MSDGHEVKEEARTRREGYNVDGRSLLKKSRLGMMMCNDQTRWVWLREDTTLMDEVSREIPVRDDDVQ